MTQTATRKPRPKRMLTTAELSLIAELQFDADTLDVHREFEIEPDCDTFIVRGSFRWSFKLPPPVEKHLVSRMTEWECVRIDGREHVCHGAKTGRKTPFYGLRVATEDEPLGLYGHELVESAIDDDVEIAVRDMLNDLAVNDAAARAWLDKNEYRVKFRTHSVTESGIVTVIAEIEQ